MLLLTGIRPCDLLNLKVSHIDLKNLVIHLDISKTQRQIKYPLYDELLNFVKTGLSYIKELDEDDFIFPGYNVSMLGRKFRRLKQRLGIEERHAYTLKTFRKTFATDLADKGFDRGDVADLLGHSIIETTRKYYVNTKAKTLRDKLNKLSKKDEKI
jgi:integrase